MNSCGKPNNTIQYLAGRLYVEKTFSCEREEGHLGYHQQLVDNRDGKCNMASWNDKFLKVLPDVLWPSKECKDCSFRLQSDDDECCKFCQFWNKVESDETYVVDGHIFKILNQAWVPERTLKVLTPEGVKEIERKIIQDCEVPLELRFRFPNNAIFKPVVAEGSNYAFVPFVEGITSQEAFAMLSDYEDWS